MHIAVCDDEKNCLDNMEQLLKSYPGISRTEYYQNLEDLSAALKSGITYDLILMDHLMPNKDGVETFKELRADEHGCNYHTPVIILTANAVAGMKQQYLDEGFDGFLSKPVQGQLLEEALRQFLPPELVHLTQMDAEDDAKEHARLELLQQKIAESSHLPGYRKILYTIIIIYFPIFINTLCAKK